jgi:hypothetical protein
MPVQGGGGLDGHALIQSWVIPASLCWLDWNAYDRADRAAFIVKSAYQSAGGQGGAFAGFHDSDSSLDGSVIRYLRITETLKGITHFTVHPNVAAFAGFTDQTVPADVDYSQSGPYGMPTELAVRDLDRAFYEVWAYGASGLHVQTRGYNLFDNTDSWASTRYPASTSSAPYTDYANMVPSLTEPGIAIGPLIQWTPSNRGIASQGLHRVKVGENALVKVATLPAMPIPEHPATSLLWP